jgi:hypothetical protein
MWTPSEIHHYKGSLNLKDSRISSIYMFKMKSPKMEEVRESTWNYSNMRKPRYIIILMIFLHSTVLLETTKTSRKQFNQGSSWSPSEAPHCREQNQQKHALAQDPAQGWRTKLSVWIYPVEKIICRQHFTASFPFLLTLFWQVQQWLPWIWLVTSKQKSK